VYIYFNYVTSLSKQIDCGECKTIHSEGLLVWLRSLVFSAFFGMTSYCIAGGGLKPRAFSTNSLVFER